MMDSTGSWEGNDLTLSTASQDDFNQFFDLGLSGMSDEGGFNFHDLAPQQQHGQIMGQQRGGVSSIDTTMGDGTAMMDIQKHGMMQGHNMPITTSTTTAVMSIPNPSPAVVNQRQPTSDASLVQIDAQIQYLQLQRQQQQQRIIQEQHQNYYVPHNNRIVPPTPNSIEMHSGERQRYQQHHDAQQQQQQAIFGSYQMHLREQELAFTPLVSPAVTPLETHFGLPEYTIPGAYFSPISSPALHAHTEYAPMYSTAHVESSATSPAEMNLDLLPPPAGVSGTGRKLSIGAGRKPTSKQRPSRAVRQSPVVKAQRRKMNSTSISAEALSELVEPALQSNSTSTSSPQQPHLGKESSSSENNSISPEHLSDMAPPPIPSSSSLKRSPYLVAQNSHPRVQQIISGNSMSPATPASLMRISRGKETMTSPSLSVHDENQDLIMEDFSLPEAANPHEEATTKVTDDNLTPTPEPNGTLSHKPLPSPATDRKPPDETAASPLVKPQTNSASANSTPSMRKTPKLAARGSQPRQSTSVQASPALLPRISPSIKPMVRGPSISDDTASLLLATKSNYQNILEGTHLPGVSYPSELSTNLTSKRTSHKIAEQGRRNRINSALQEIATLLPSGSGGGGGGGGEKSGSADAEAGEKGEEEGGKGTQSSSSKASTVEHAIEYIKQLKHEVEEATKRAEAAEKKLREQGQGQDQDQMA